MPDCKRWFIWRLLLLASVLPGVILGELSAEDSPPERKERLAQVSEPPLKESLPEAGPPQQGPKADPAPVKHLLPEAEKNASLKAKAPVLGKSEAQREELATGWAMLVGISLGGLCLVVLVIIWGRRMRRLVNQPVKSCPQPDELWFLKHPPKPPEDSV